MHKRERMPDECPYQRPFPLDFRDCEAYSGTEFVALDLQHRPLPSVLTCQQLTVGLGESSGSHYARCRIGDEGARSAWVVQVHRDAVLALRELSVEARDLLRPLIRHLWEAKGATLRDPGDAAAQRDLRLTAEALQEGAAGFYRAHPDELAMADLTPAVTIELVRRVVDNFVVSRSPSPELAVTDEMLAGLPHHVRLLIRPDEGAEQAH